MSGNSKDSGETMLMRRLTLAVAGCLCDKYPFLMYWLIFVLPSFSHVFGQICLSKEGGVRSDLKWSGHGLYCLTFCLLQMDYFKINAGLWKYHAGLFQHVSFP